MLWVVIPALNEDENLRDLLPRVLAEVSAVDTEGHVLVIDDGSTDETAAVVTELAAEGVTGKNLELESFRNNHGKAHALQVGFRRALAGGATRVIMMDADGQDDPAEIPRLLAKLEEGFDLVTGARLERNDRFVKRSTSKVYNKVTSVLSGAPGKDFNSGLKAMSAEVVGDVSPMMYGEMHRYLTVIAYELGHRVTEVPVAHHERMHGSSKYGMNRFWRGMMDLLTVRFLLNYENRPSHLFGGIGALVFLAGFLTLAYLTVVKIEGHAIGDRPLLIAGVLMFLTGLQLTLFGLLAELVVHARNQSNRS